MAHAISGFFCFKPYSADKSCCHTFLFLINRNFLPQRHKDAKVSQRLMCNFFSDFIYTDSTLVFYGTKFAYVIPAKAGIQFFQSLLISV